MTPELIEIDDNSVIAFGDTIKALGDPTKGDYKIGGYLVRFGSKKDTDLEGEFFTSKTDFGLSLMDTSIPVATYYHHAQDGLLGKAIIGKGKITADDVGLWYEAQLEMNDQYINKLKQAGVIKSQLKSTAKKILDSIYTGIQDKKFGWSSGVKFSEREAQDNGTNWIKTWHIVDGTITPTPAEYRNTVQTVKSFKSILFEHEDQTSEAEDGEDNKTQTESSTQKVGATMSASNLKTLKGLCDDAKTFSKKLNSYYDTLKPAQQSSTTSKALYEKELKGKLENTDKTSITTGYLEDEDGWSIAYHVHSVADLLYYNAAFIDLNALATELERLAALVSSSGDKSSKAMIYQNTLQDDDGWSIAYHVHKVADLLYYNPQFIDLEAIAGQLLYLASVIRKADSEKTSAASSDDVTDDTDKTEEKTVSDDVSDKTESPSSENEKLVVSIAELDNELFEAVSIK